MRRCSCEPVEESREMALVAEPRLKAHFNEWYFTFGQQRLGTVDTKLYQVLMRRRPSCSLELAREMKAAHFGHPRQFSQFQVACVVVSDKGHHLPQSLSRQPAREPLRAASCSRVVPQEMNRQNI